MGVGKVLFQVGLAAYDKAQEKLRRAALEEREKIVAYLRDPQRADDDGWMMRLAQAIEDGRHE